LIFLEKLRQFRFLPIETFGNYSILEKKFIGVRALDASMLVSQGNPGRRLAQQGEISAWGTPDHADQPRAASATPHKPDFEIVASVDQLSRA
jgi:hypothetical protein